MTRVLIVEAAGNLWGSERALLDLLDGLKGLDLAVCCPPNTPIVSELENLKVRVLPWFIANLHKKSRYQRLWAAISVVRACFVFQAQVIYVNQSGSFKIASIAAKLLNISVVSHVRIFEDAAYLALQKPRPDRLVCLVAISEEIEAEIRRFSQLSDITVKQIYDAYKPISSSNIEHKPPTKNRVVCVGRITAIKGQDILIEALKLLDENIECLMIGDGEPNFVKRLKATSVDVKGLRWVGFVSDVMPILQSSSILVCPSHREPLGRVIFEAWDAGCVPVVYSGSGGAAEIIRASKGGIIYDEATPLSLSLSLKYALELSVPTKNNLIKRGQNWMQKKCDLDLYAEQLKKIFEEACI